MVQTVASCTLTAPTTDPNVGAGSSFTMTAALTWSGHGGAERVSVFFEWSTSSGGSYSTIGASGVLTTTNTNPASTTTSPVSISVTGVTPGTYWVHARAVGSSTFTSASQQVTVKLGSITGSLAAVGSGSDSTAISGGVTVAGSAIAVGSGSDSAAVNGTVTVSGSVVAVGSGLDAAVVSGGPEDVGALIAQESGPDVLAASGTVANPSIVGNLAAVGGGNDSAVVSGAVSISGSLAAFGNGNDSTTASGGVTVAGSAAAVGSGSDGAVASGTIVVAGSAAAVGSGDDSALASGSVVITGSGAAVGSGLDVFSGIGSLVSGTITVVMSAIESLKDQFFGAAVGAGSSGYGLTRVSGLSDNSGFVTKAGFTREGRGL